MKNRFIADSSSITVIKKKVIKEMVDARLEVAKSKRKQRMLEVIAEAGFRSTQSRGPGGKWVSEGLSKRALAKDDPNGLKVYGNDPKAPTKVAEKYGLNVARSKAKQDALVKEGLNQDKSAEEGSKWEERYAKDKQSLDRKLKEGKTTEYFYGVEFDSEGRATAYNNRRTKLHDEILAEERAKMSKVPKSEPPVMYVIMGRPGSGKSSFQKKGVTEGQFKDQPHAFWTEDKYYTADPDYFKARLGVKPNEVGLGHEESSYLNKIALKQATESRSNIILDQTLASDKTRLIQSYKDEGYDIKLVGVSSPISTSIKNSAYRYTIPKGGDTGRLVPTEVSANNITNEQNFEKLIPLASEWKYYTNQLDPTAEFGFTQVAGSNL